jgi:3-oxoadipate enol-lactonase
LGRDVTGILDALGVKQASFCGISMGGLIGQWLGIYAPEYLERLILANTTARSGTVESWNARIDTVERQGMKAIVPGLLDRWFTRDFQAAAAETVAGFARMLEAADVRGYAACCAALRDTDLRASVERISVPTLVISGTEDSATSPGEGRFLAERIPGARYLLLQAAHLSNVEAARDFTTAAIDFLLP